MDFNSEEADEDAGAIDWTIAEGWRSFILGPDAPNWGRLGSFSGAELVKSNAVRRVWKVSAAARCVYVKDYAAPTFRRVVRAYLRGSDAMKEWEAGAEAERLGVPCVRFVACGQGRRRGYLMSEAVAGAERLSDAWRRVVSLPEAAEQKRLRDALTEAAARLIARAHEAGFAHNDEHPDNILVTADGVDQFNALYVDVAKAAHVGPLDESKAAHSLAQLHQWFQQRATKTERMRLIRIYCDERCGGDVRRARRLLRRIAKATIDETHELAAQWWAKRDRRILRTNAYFARLRLDDGSRAHVTVRFRQRDAYPAASVDDLSAEQWQQIIQGEWGAVPSTLNIRSETSGIDGPEDDSRRRFVTGHRLCHRDIPCRRPVAVFQSRGLRGDEIWFDSNPRSIGVVEFLRRAGNDHAGRRRVMRALGELVRVMSDRGVFVREARNETFGVDEAGLDVLIDETRGVVVHGRAPKADRLRTTRALYELSRREAVFRRTDAVRYLKAAAPWRWKRVWRRVAFG